MEKKQLLDTIAGLIDLLLVSRNRDKQTELELNLAEFAKLIYEKKENYYAKKFPVERLKNAEFVNLRGDNTSDLRTMKEVNKKYAGDIIILEAYEAEIKILEERYKSYIRVANHINDRFIQDNVDNKRNVN